MPVLVRIAIRNLREHKAKTLIIGIIIATGVMVLVAGNSLMNTVSSGIRNSFIDKYTGHVMISGIAKGKVSLFGVQTPGGIEETPTIPDYKKVRNYIENRSRVDFFTSQVTGFGIMKVEGKEDIETNAFSLFVGMEPESYHKMFDNLDLIEGKYLESGEEGILISEGKRNKLEKTLEISLSVGDMILINSFGASGFKIREVPIRGIFNFKQKSEGADMLSYVDIQTLRELKGMTITNMGELELETKETTLLESADPDALFNDTELYDNTEGTGDSGEINIYDVFDKTEKQEVISEIDTGAWEYLLIKLESQIQSRRFISSANKWFKEEGIYAQASDWKTAAGPFSTTADVIRVIFNVAVIMVAIVSVIIIMNTLVISVIERTSEIGTMRALGAQKGFIKNMFIFEITTISIIFGFIGIIFGLLALWIIELMHFAATNPLLEILYAGPVLKPVIDVKSLFITWGMVIVFGILANLYPLSIALKIEPVKAITTE